MNRMRPLVLGAITAAALTAPALATAQQQPTLEELRRRYTLPAPGSDGKVLALPRSLPALNASTPSAFGAGWGQYLIGAGYQAETRATLRGGGSGVNDGAVVVGGGLGNANVVALEVAYTSYSTTRSGLFDRGGVSVKLHRQFANGLALAVGRERAIVVGNEGDGGASTFAAASKVFSRGSARQPFSTFAVTVGAGDGRFRTVNNILADKNTINTFAAVAVRVLEPVGLTADWNGQALSAAVSLVPLRCLPLVITPGYTDLAGPGNLKARFVLGVGLGLTNRTLRTVRNTACF